MRYKQITLIGTSHIAKQSIDEVTEYITVHKPDVVAVELDRKRLHALLAKQHHKLQFHMIFRVGIKGFIFALIGQYVQRKLGKLVGVAPGSDMIAAVKTARKMKSEIFLIDQDIEQTLSKFSRALTWKEKWRFFVDVTYALFFKEKAMQEMGLDAFALDKVPPKELIKKLTQRVKMRYPNVYRVLIEERNHIMARRLVNLAHEQPEKSILAVIGAGHEEDMYALLKKYWALFDK